jgi:hypothetical protein
MLYWKEARFLQEQWTIGVCGHRHLPPERHAALTAEIQTFYKAQEERYNAKRITVLSPLAEGADALCAKLAVDRDLRLVVPLPMSKSEYRKDFSADVATEFDFLLSAADETFTVAPQETATAHPPRGFYYRQAGIYVAKNCDILLAVWDGEKRNTPDGAGTWETIKLAQEFEKPIFRVMM